MLRGKELESSGIRVKRGQALGIARTVQNGGLEGQNVGTTLAVVRMLRQITKEPSLWAKDL